MRDIEIPREEWWRFCAGYALEHRGWLVGMYRIDTPLADAKVRTPAEPLFEGYRPLLEIRQGATGGADMIEVKVGEGEDETAFPIDAAVALYSRETRDGHQGLRIDGAGHRSTLIEFRIPSLPESLDGLAALEL